jgi:hypothetical protein
VSECIRTAGTLLHSDQALSDYGDQAGRRRQGMADGVRLHPFSMGRDEAGTSPATLGSLLTLPLARSCRSGALMFAPGERGPSDDARLQLQASAAQLGDEEKDGFVKDLLLRKEARGQANGS